VSISGLSLHSRAAEDGAEEGLEDQAEGWTNRAVEIWLATAIVNPLALSPVSGPTSPELLASDSPKKVLWFCECTDSLIAPSRAHFQMNMASHVHLPQVLDALLIPEQDTRKSLLSFANLLVGYNCQEAYQWHFQYFMNTV
jgi:hypothetical protein